MSGDEERQALARAREAAPNDLGLAARYARVLARSGDVAAAEDVLVQALDLEPGHVELTAELDALTRGRRRGAPWPSRSGDPSRTARSLAVGPSRGRVVARIELELPETMRDIVIESPTRTILTTRQNVFAIGSSGEVSLAVELPSELDAYGTVLLPGERTLTYGPARALVIAHRDGRVERVARSYARAALFGVGSSGLLYVGGGSAGRLDALALAAPAEARPFLRIGEGTSAGLALAPGGDVVVIVGGDRRDARPTVVSRLSSSGDLRWRRELDSRGLGRARPQVVIASDGTAAFAIAGDGFFALDAKGDLVFEVPYRGDPVGLAGERGEHLVVRDGEELVLADGRTGRPRTRLGQAERHASLQVDARGWIYTRRGDDLVAWDPTAPTTLALEVQGVGVRFWEFALAGEEKIYAFVRSGDRNELVVIE